MRKTTKIISMDWKKGNIVGMMVSQRFPSTVKNCPATVKYRYYAVTMNRFTRLDNFFMEHGIFIENMAAGNVYAWETEEGLWWLM